MPSGPVRLARRSAAGLQVAACLILGAIAAAVIAQFTAVSVAVLAGWVVAAACYLLWVWAAVGRADAETTRALAGREDPSNVVAELVVVIASVAALGAVGYALARAAHAHGGHRTLLVGLAALTVVVSWLVVHTVFMLGYARSYYADPEGGIDFNSAGPPEYGDFAYFAFTIGMTFQVSDTDITSTAIRRQALRHALLSYLFGAVILATAVNGAASLLG